MTVQTIAVAVWYQADTSNAFAFENPERAGAAAPESTIGKIERGTSGKNTLKGTGLDDYLAGLGGNDVLSGRSGSDILDGGSGNDKVLGGSGVDVLDGGTGNDTVSGGAGIDLILGGKGNDRLTGGSGKDVFWFETSLHRIKNVDWITDYSPKHDTIAIYHKVFKKAGKANKTLDSDAFWKGAAAQDASDRIIYDKGTGALYYDPDGTGAAAQVKFAQLKANLALTYKDLEIV